MHLGSTYSIVNFKKIWMKLRMGNGKEIELLSIELCQKRNDKITILAQLSYNPEMWDTHAWVPPYVPWL
jgi:hypothetical protein